MRLNHALVLLGAIGLGSPTLTDAGQGRRLQRPIVVNISAISGIGSFSLPSFPATPQQIRYASSQAVGSADGASNATAWQAGAVLRWNAVARELVKKRSTPAVLASRVYALLSVAQADVLYVVSQLEREARVGAAVYAQNKSVVEQYATVQSALAGASVAILSYALPEEDATIESIAQPNGRLAAAVSAAEVLGRKVAEQVIARARSDGHDATPQSATPTGPGVWSSWMGQAPLLPAWGAVKPWVLPHGREALLAAPPRFGSPEFVAALKEVRRLSDTRTAEQRRIAEFWADTAGSYTPPGRWNEIAEALIRQYQFDDYESARVFALLNMAMMDAGIAVWYNKYRYWLPRPSQADPAITLPIGLPNFPAYPSGHAGFSGAAATVLAAIFPEKASGLEAMAQEAAILNRPGKSGDRLV